MDSESIIQNLVKFSSILGCYLSEGSEGKHYTVDSNIVLVNPANSELYSSNLLGDRATEDIEINFCEKRINNEKLKDWIGDDTSRKDCS